MKNESIQTYVSGTSNYDPARGRTLRARVPVDSSWRDSYCDWWESMDGWEKAKWIVGGGGHLLGVLLTRMITPDLQ